MLAMNMHKSQRLRDAADKLYTALTDAGIDVLFDDRPIRPGVMFADIELIGIPHRIVMGERGLDQGIVEYKARTDTDHQEIASAQIVAFLQDKLSASLPQ